MDLDQYSERELLEELLMRYRLRSKELCDYCGHTIWSVGVCDYPDRHQKLQSVASLRTLLRVLGNQQAVLRAARPEISGVAGNGALGG